MTNDKKITFQIGKTKIIINDKKDKVNIKNEDNNFNRELTSVFKNLAQANQLEKLETIFSKIGDNSNNRELDNDDIAFLEQFLESGKSTQDYMIKIIDEKLKGIDNLPKEATTTIPANSSAESVTKKSIELANTKPADGNNKNLEPKANVNNEEQKTKYNDFRDSNVHQYIAKKMLEIKNNTELDTSNFTITAKVVAGDTLWKISKKALISEGNKNPSNKEIMDRCALIAQINDIKPTRLDVILGKTYKVGYAEGKIPAKVPVQEQSPAGSDPSSIPASGQPPVVEPLVAEYTPILLQGDLKDPDTNGWDIDSTYELQGFELKNGSLTKYTKTTTTGEGENATSTTEEKFVYEKDGVKFEAGTENEIKTKIETFNNALEELTKTVENEESATTTARVDKAYTDIINLGSKSAVKFAHKKMMEGNTDESAELYLNLTKDLLYKGDPELFGEDVLPTSVDKDLSKLVNGDENVQKVVGEYIKYLEEKYNNSTITPNESTMLENLRPLNPQATNLTALKGIHIDYHGPSGQEEMDLWTDIHGNSYWQSPDEPNYRTLDKDVLDDFLYELNKESDYPDFIFETFTAEGADPELVKSLAKQANDLNVSADKILALVAHADLDVLYALDYSHLSDQAPQVEEGQPAQKSPKALVEEAILERKKTLLNSNPIEKMQGLDISNKTPENTESTNITSLKEDLTNPETKAKVHNLLLTRNAEVIKELITKDDGNGNKVLDNTLFKNDPVALKTLAALLKELRDKENAGDRLSADEIALKEAIKANGTYGFYAEMQDGKLLSFNGDGDLVVLKDDRAKSIATNSEMLDRPVDLTDPVILADKVLLKYILQNDNDALAKLNKDQLLDLISNLDSAYLLGTFDFNKISQNIKDDTTTLKDVQDAYINKAKELFTFEEVEGQKLDPTGAASLKYVINIIDGFNKEVDGSDADDVAISDIIGQFFKTETTTDESGNSVETVKLKDFRRFTYEEMKDLVNAMDLYIHDDDFYEKIDALIALFNVENLEKGQFGASICKGRALSPEYFEPLVRDITTEDEALKLIENINFDAWIPFNAIIDKFKENQNIMNKLLTVFGESADISDANKEILFNSLINSEGNATIPEDADISGLAYLLPDEKAQDGENLAITMSENQKKVFKALVNATDDFNTLAMLVNKASQTNELRDEAENRIMYLLESLTAENLNKAIDAFETLPMTLATKMIESSHITEISEDISKCKAKVFESALKNKQNCVELYNKAIDNGWLNSETLQSGEQINATWYSFGNAEMVASYSTVDNKVVTKQKAEILNELATQDGKNKANEIYSLVSGANTGDETKTLRDNLKDPNYITKDNVVALLNQWQTNSRNEGIIEYLNREWNGPTIAEMEVIPKALIALAEENGLSSEEAPLKSLIESVNDPDLKNKDTTDYPNHSYAKSIDNLMKEVLNKLSEQNNT